jgi:hypothetical protein
VNSFVMPVFSHLREESANRRMLLEGLAG